MSPSTSLRLAALLLLAAAPSIATAQLPAPRSINDERSTLDDYLSRGRTKPGARLTSAQLGTMYANRVRNPINGLLRAADTLRLTDTQLDEIAGYNRAIAGLLGAAWTQLGESLARLPDRYDLDEAWSHLNVANTLARSRWMWAVGRTNALLSDEQWNKLQPETRAMLDPRCVERVFPTAPLPSGQTTPALSASPPDAGIRHSC